MKKYLLVAYLFLALVFLSCSNNSTSPSNTNDVTYSLMQENIPNIVKLDIKTKLIGKTKVTGVKNGLIGYLKSADCQWVDKVVETGETYSVWITNFSKNEIDSNVTIDVDLELRTPAFLTEGTMLRKEHIKLNYFQDKDWIGQAGMPNAQQVATRMLNYSNLLKKAGQLEPIVNNIITRSITTAQATTPAALLIPLTYKFSNYLNQWVSMYTSEDNLKSLQADAIIAGAFVYGRLQQMVYAEQHK